MQTQKLSRVVFVVVVATISACEQLDGVLLPGSETERLITDSSCL